MRIRLVLVKTPETEEMGDAEAAQFISILRGDGKTVLVDQDDRQKYDKYNRIIVVVYCDNVLINAELLFKDHVVIMQGYLRL